MSTKKEAPLLNKTGDHLALMYFQLGCRLLERRAKLGKRVSDDKLRQIAKEVGLEIRSSRVQEIRYKSIEMSKVFEHDPSELTRLCLMRNDDDEEVRLTLSHIIELMRLPNAQKRQRIAKFALQNKVSCLVLRAEIRRQLGWTGKRPGATPRPPKSEAHAILRANRELQALEVILGQLIRKPRRRKLMKELLSKVRDLVVDLEQSCRACSIIDE